MSGGRHIDWTHVQVDGGDRTAAAPYLGDGRKLLGVVMEDAGRSQLGVHAMTKTLPDGAVIVAEKFGDIPRIRITPPLPEAPEPPVPSMANFVVWARTSALPAGIDATHPEQILRPEWTTYFYSGDVAGHDAFEGEKGTYAGVFPAGVRRAGNIDWCSRAGERVNWYGPSARYWYDGFRQPRAQFGKHVFSMGATLLGVDAYCTASEINLAERYIMGAAKVGNLLYVVMADLPAEVTWLPPPAAAGATPDGWATPSYPTVGVAVAMRRFTLVSSPSLPGPMKYVVANGSATTLWTGVLPRAVSPWHFDATGKTAVAHLPPASEQMLERGAAVIRPSVSHTRAKLTVDGAGAALETSEVSMPAGTGVSGLLAEDDAHTLHVVRGVDGDSNGMAYRLHGHTYPAAFVTYGAGGGIGAGTRHLRRQLLWADLREDVLILDSKDVVFTGIAPELYGYVHSIVLCQGGVETVLASDSSPVTMFLAGDMADIVHARLAAAPVAPLALAHLVAFGVFAAEVVQVHDAGCSLLGSSYNLPFRKAQSYGQKVWAAAAGPWTNEQTNVTLAKDIGANTQVDGLEHTTFPGFASEKGYTLASYHSNDPGWQINGRRLAVSAATGANLATLTGVPGAPATEGGQLSSTDARYHPIWILGKPPQGQTTP